MTPKEKALELTDKYIKYTPVKFDFENARQCALIAVDNIMEVLHSDEIYNPGMLSFDRIENYWIEVKKEILTIKNK